MLKFCFFCYKQVNIERVCFFIFSDLFFCKNFCGHSYGSKHTLLLSYFLMVLCVSWNCAECQGTSEIVFMTWILKKGVRFPELKTAAFAIPALSWCSAGRTSYSSRADSWHQEELVMGIPSGEASLLLVKSCSPALFVCELKAAKIWKNSAFKAVVSVRCGDFCGQWPPAAYLPSQGLKRRGRVNIQVLLPGSDGFLLKNCSWNCHGLARQLWKQLFFNAIDITNDTSFLLSYSTAAETVFRHFHILRCFEFFLLSFPLCAELLLKSNPGFVYNVRAILKKKCVSVSF